MAAINGDWLEALKDEFKKDYYKQLFEKVNEEYRTRLIFHRQMTYLTHFI